MGKAGSKLSAKERIGYEVFFFTAVYGLYNVFFALPLAVDTIVFTALFGSLFVRYHLVVSDGNLDESRASRWTGTAMFLVSVTIVSHISFKWLKLATAGFGSSLEPYLILVGGAVSAISLFTVFNHPMFRHDEQRRATLKEGAEEEGAIGLIARIGLFIERKSENGNYEFDLESRVDFEETRNLMRKQREGEITSEQRDQLRQEIKHQRDFGKILFVGAHTAISVVVLLVSVSLLELFTSVEAVVTLGLVLLVFGVYFSFSMLHTRFGLRREISRELRKMPIELLLCIVVAFVSLSNADLIGGGGIIITVPFTLYLMTSHGSKITKKVIWTILKYFRDPADSEYSDVIQEVMKEDG